MEKEKKTTKKHSEQVNVSFDLIASDWLKKMTEIGHSLHWMASLTTTTHLDSRLSSQFYNIAWTLFCYVQVLEWDA